MRWGAFLARHAKLTARDRASRHVGRRSVAVRRSIAFAAFLAPLKKTKWFVYSNRPFANLVAVLAYLARYTHPVAIANSRLIALDDEGVTFNWKDYRRRARAIEDDDTRDP